MAKRYNSHITYVLSIDNGKQIYVGSHNGNRTYTTTGIISQSGNPLQKIAVETKNWTDYYNRVSLAYLYEFEDEESALQKEQELLDLLFTILPKERILNRSRKANQPSSNYRYDHDEEWKQKYSESMKKPKSMNSLRAKRGTAV